MEGFPKDSQPMSMAAPPVSGVAAPAVPIRPAGVLPGHTQAPSERPGWLSGLGLPPAPVTYAQPAPLGSGTAGGIQGVSMAPVSGVVPPAVPGGPHPLPALPQVPLPQGFPNPFQVQQLGAAPAVPGGAPQPGVTYVTGPQGHHHGIGYFGTPPQGGFPGLPGPLQTAAGPASPAPQLPLFGPLPQAGPAYQVHPVPQASFVPAMGAGPQAPATTPVAPTPAAPAPAQAPHPFWVQLAWQLLQTPPVRSALGDKFAELVEGQHRLHTLQVASGCITGQELQEAFRSLTAGTLEQGKFVEAFADALRAGLQAAGRL